MRNAAYANAGIAIIAESARYMGGGVLFNGERSHSASDALVHYGRYRAELSGRDQSTTGFRAFIASSMLIPAAFLVHTAFESFQRLQDGSSEAGHSLVNMTGALLILGFNGYAYDQTRKIEEQSCSSHASHSHARADFAVSSVYSAGLIIESLGVSSAGDVVNAGASAYASLHLGKEALSMMLKREHVSDHH